MELGLVELLKKCRHEIFNCNPAGLILEAKSKEWSRQLTCDIFLTGANAITLTGEIVNRDAFGRRIVAMMFGPKKVIVVAGIDKVVRDVDAAKGQEASAPCAEPGECVDCSTLRQSCNITSVLHRYPPLTDIHVVIVGECLSLSNH
jgi:L-lactate utilization protein LutB